MTLQKSNWIRRLLTLAVLGTILSQGIVSLSFASQSSAQKPLDGIWLGVVEVSGIKVRMILRVSRNSAGALSARVDVPDQGASDLPVESITVERQLVRFEASNLGTYQGTLSADASELVGELKQETTTLPITFSEWTRLPRWVALRIRRSHTHTSKKKSVTRIRPMR